MKKVCAMIALAAVCYGSVYAAEAPATNAVPAMAQDTVKKKVKVKDGKVKKKAKVKKDTTKVE
jgi:opacity protein-like surface antigen